MRQEKVVLDTNIIISAAISLDGKPARIFELFLNGDLVNYSSKEIIEEVTEVISRPFFGISEEYRDFIISNLKDKSIIIKPSFNEEIITEDVSDNKFINCALSAKACIISGDRHLLKLRIYKGVRVFSATEFLK